MPRIPNPRFSGLNIVYPLSGVRERSFIALTPENGGTITLNGVKLGNSTSVFHLAAGLRNGQECDQETLKMMALSIINGRFSMKSADTQSRIPVQITKSDEPMHIKVKTLFNHLRRQSVGLLQNIVRDGRFATDCDWLPKGSVALVLEEPVSASTEDHFVGENTTA